MLTSELERIEDEIINVLKVPDWMVNKKSYRDVFIVNGGAIDEITDYEIILKETTLKRERSVRFRTSASIFPAYIRLSDYNDVRTETEGYGHPLYIHVN